MDDGGRIQDALKIATNNFTLKECVILKNILINKYKLKVSIQSAGKNQYLIYIYKESIPLLYSIVKPYIIPSMKYKFAINN